MGQAFPAALPPATSTRWPRSHNPGIASPSAALGKYDRWAGRPGSKRSTRPRMPTEASAPRRRWSSCKSDKWLTCPRILRALIRRAVEAAQLANPAPSTEEDQLNSRRRGQRSGRMKGDTRAMAYPDLDPTAGEPEFGDPAQLRAHRKRRLALGYR